VKDATKRGRKPRSLAVDEFPLLVQQLEEPFRIMALLCLCFGLRISECLALKWSDVDWLNGTLSIERGIVPSVHTAFATRSVRGSMWSERRLECRNGSCGTPTFEPR
jgi:integrase